MISNQYENFQQPFTPTPKGSLMEILLTGMKEIKCTPFRAGENEVDFRQPFTPAPKGSLLEILLTKWRKSNSHP